jgi:DNA-binding transcriptional regulator YiaG
VKFAEALHTSVAYLMGWEEQKEKPTDDDGLSEEMKELIDHIKKLPEDKVQMLLQVARSIR